MLAAFLAASFRPAPLDAIDSLLNDWRLRLGASGQQESRIVIVDVDEASLAREGAWPWPRERIARLLQTLIDEHGVAAVAVDMVFPEPREGEDALGEQFRRPEVTAAVVYDLGARELPAIRTRFAPPPALEKNPYAPLMNGIPVVANHARLAGGRAGHITPIFDTDGALRRVPPLICTQGKNCRPVLGLAAYAGLMEQSSLRLRAGQGWLAPPWQLDLRDGGGNVLTSLPLRDDGTLVVPYRHRGDHWIQTVSAADVLAGTADKEALKGVIALFGGTALGMADVVSTPMSPLAAGIVPHAEVLSAALDNAFPWEPAWGLSIDAVLLLPFAFLLVWALGRFDQPAQRAALFPIWLLLTWLGCGALALGAYATKGVLLPLLPLVLFPALALLFTVLAEVYRSRSAHAGLLGLLATYLPRQVAARLAGAGTRQARAEGVMDASRRDITVLFADVHGFAGMTEDRPPEVVARLMQRVFSEMAESVVQHQGTIDKFIGDAIMAFWNAPEDDPQHAAHALACAHDIRRRMHNLTSFCAELGLPSIQIGIGLESGLALVGNFGSSHRRTYTALGEPVVLASRLEGLTKTYNEAILVGPTCAQILGSAQTRQLCTVQIRGRIHPLTLYVPE